MNAWLKIVGIGEDGLEGLSNRAREIVSEAEVMIGGERHLGLVPEGGAERVTWGEGLNKGIGAIEANEGRRVVVLASGDPMYFGIGATLLKRFGIQASEIIPAPNAFSLAAARMGWSIPDVTCLTLHGRQLENVNLHLRPEGRILLLSWDGTTSKKLAELLTKKGYGNSIISVLENMGGEKENRIEGNAVSWSIQETAALNTIAVHLRAHPAASAWSRVAGLPENAYSHDNLITKREVRAITLAALAPLPGQILWDVGAGNGSVAIEWLRVEPLARAIAIEKIQTRAANARFNCIELGVPGLEVIESSAPEAFEGINVDPDAIFIGGGLNSNLLRVCWHRLKPGGRLVANAVTLEGYSALLAQRDECGGELCEIAISREASVGSRAGLKPLMAVLQLRGLKS